MKNIKESIITNAQEVLSEAQKAYSNCGRDFLESKAEHVSFKMIAENCRRKDALKDYIDTEKCQRIINECTDIRQIRRSLGYIRECNAIRINLGFNALKVSYDLMIGSIFGVAFYADHTEEAHRFINNNTAIKFRENLITCPNESTDPFVEWYYIEKAYAELSKSESKSRETVDSIIKKIEAEAARNGHGLYAGRLSSCDDLADAMLGCHDPESETGHYKNIKSRADITGFAISYHNRYLGQAFDKYRINTKSYDVDAAERDFDLFVKSRADILAEAEEKCNQIITKYSISKAE